jgi:DNA-binding MarR family transcriptional regulator
LVKKGLLQRHQAAEDARAYAVTVTEKGWSALRDSAPAAERADARFLAALPKKDVEEFLRALSIVTDACQFDKSQGPL